jgi:tRNA A37 threonylcarbamoyladenosine biosynthesis protein TsaE
MVNKEDFKYIHRNDKGDMNMLSMPNWSLANGYMNKNTELYLIDVYKHSKTIEVIQL